VGTAQDLERRFLALISEWLLALPHDLKVLFEAKDDPNLERKAREIAAGAILYVLNPDTSSDEKFVGFADDAIILRTALAAVLEHGGEGAEDFRSRFDEYYQSLEADLDLCRKAMGDTYSWLAGKIESLPKQVYKGKKVPQYIDDEEHSEMVYEDGLAFATEFPIDENKLGMRLKKPETLLEPLRRKALEERKKIA
jgi:uncharacterized membrane protein YkvA (DUF1232 family)